MLMIYGFNRLIFQLYKINDRREIYRLSRLRGDLFTMTATSSETVKFKWDGGGLIPDVQKTQYADGGYDSVDCQNCGNTTTLGDLEQRENKLVCR